MTAHSILASFGPFAASPATLGPRRARTTLSCCAPDAGRDAAGSFLQDALPRRQRVLGADHPETRQIADVLARAWPYSARV
jgi:hypothetical protein